MTRLPRFGRVSRLKRRSKKLAGILLLLVPGLFLVGFSQPHHFSAHAAGWLDRIFGDFRPRTRSRSRYKAPARIRIPKTIRPARGRGAWGIGRIDPVRRLTRQKRSRRHVPKSAGTYRTMCVRTCDGFYFPVSFATRKGNLARDAKACQSSCGAPARLYYYPNPGGNPEEMISYKGKEKYTKLANAFLFRKQFVADCRCKPEPWTAAAKQLHQKYARLEKQKAKRTASSRKYAKSRRYSRWRRGKRRRARNDCRVSSRRRGLYIRRIGARRSERSIRIKRRSPRRTTSWTF